MKKIKLLMSIILIVSLIMPINITINGSEKTNTYEDFIYEIVKDEGGINVVNIKDYIGNDENLVVPDMINDYKVVSISSSYRKDIKLKTMKISQYVEDISGFKLDIDYFESYFVDSENNYFSSENGVLYNKEKTRLLIYPMGKQDEEFIEPSSVETSTGINNNPYLKKLTLSNNIRYTETAERGYYNSNLEEITIPGNIKNIGLESFMGSKKLKKINFSNGLKSIRGNAFSDCISLTELDFPNSLSKIYAHAFYGCYSIENVYLPKKLQIIERNAFAFCSKLKKVNIPDTVVKVGNNAFEKWTGKTKVKMRSYMKKTYNVYGNGKLFWYTAKATVTSNGKTKDYKAANITKIKGEKKNITVNKDKSKKLKTTVFIKNKKKGTLKSNILKFSSSNKRVVKVTANGKIKALKRGKATITVKLRTSNKKYKVKVKVI